MVERTLDLGLVFPSKVKNSEVHAMESGNIFLPATSTLSSCHGPWLPRSLTVVTLLPCTAASSLREGRRGMSARRWECKHFPKLSQPLFLLESNYRQWTGLDLLKRCFPCLTSAGEDSCTETSCMTSATLVKTMLQ